MKAKLKISKWSVIAVLVIVLFFVLGYFCITLINNELKEETHIYLSEIARQGANLVETKVNDQLETIGAIGRMIETGGNFDENYMISVIQPEAERNAFKRMGIILPDGKASTTDGLSFDFNDREYFKKAMTGKEVVSDTIVDLADGENINVYATPIYNGTRIEGVLFAAVETDVYKSLLGVSTFSDQGYSYVIKTNGDVVVESLHPNSIGEFKNLFETLENAQFKVGDDLKTLKEKMLQGESGSFTSEYEGREQYVNYEPLSINDWYIMSVVPTSVVNTRSINISKYAFMFIAIGLIVIAILFVVILVSQNRSKKKLEKIAYIDEVTGGNNWYKFQVEAHKILEAANGRAYAFVLLDIDRFRFINEEYGHALGDVVLTQVMEILTANLGRYETCGRVSGDNFAILSRRTTEAELTERIKKFVDILNHEKLKLDIKEKINCNFGIYEIKDKTEDLEEIREKANMARIEAKTGEGLVWFFYSEKFREEIAQEKEIEDHMEYALENNEFKMYLQPKFNLHTNRFCGAEALARWKHPEKGLVFPNDFIPVFEKNGFITILDIYMVEEVCKVLKNWEEKGYPEIKVSVNISRKNLGLASFISEILGLADKYEIKRHCLEIELTESSVFEDVNRMIATGKKLQEHGFEISMDDFGSGYSSINLLGTLPLNTIKLDQGFFSENLENERRFIVVKAVIDLVKKLGMTVVAEGIETPEEVEILKEIKCDIIQGYFYGEPMPIEDFENLVFEKQKYKI